MDDGYIIQYVVDYEVSDRAGRSESMRIQTFQYAAGVCVCVCVIAVCMG
jgi:hypothetical protein